MQSVFLASCALAAASDQGYGANSVDGAYALFPCGTSASTTIMIARVDSTGAIDTSTTFAVGSGSPPRGVASVNGSFVYALYGESLYLGAFGSSLATVTGTHWYYGAAIGAFVAGPAFVATGCSSSSICGSGGALYRASPALPSVPGGATLTSAVSGVSSIPASGAVVVASPYTIYVGSDATTLASSSGLRKVCAWPGGVQGTGWLGGGKDAYDVPCDLHACEIGWPMHGATPRLVFSTPSRRLVAIACAARCSSRMRRER